MGTLKARLETDMRASMKARDELRTSTLRMALAAVRTAEVAGTQARELSDEEVLAVLTREVKKRREAAGAFAAAGRADSAAKERAEEQILDGYLPRQLDDAELARIVAEALVAAGIISTAGAGGAGGGGGGGGDGRSAMGPAMKAAQAAVAGRAEGGRVAAEVRRQLGA